MGNNIFYANRKCMPVILIYRAFPPVSLQLQPVAALMLLDHKDTEGSPKHLTTEI